MVKTKIYFCLFLTVFISLCLLLFFSFFYTNSKSWQQNVDTNFEVVQEVNDNGDIVNVNYISTPEQLAGMFSVINQTGIFADDFSTNTDLSNKIYKLKNDINLSGKTWTCSNMTSGYTFDGNYCTISNLTISASSGENIGFIAYNYGTIKNLIFKNANVSFTKQNTTTRIGVVSGCSSGTIENCVVTSGNVSCTRNTNSDSSTKGVGGIIGRVDSGSITKCINYATIENGSHIGGIVGILSRGTINYCYNYGQVSSSIYKNIRLGGIVGEASSSATKIEKCYNSGKITATNSGYVANTDVAVGGIVGYCYVPVEQCENAGDITVGGGNSNSTIQTAYVGGICGRSSNSVQNCINSASNIKSATKAITVTSSNSKALADNYSAKPDGFIAIPFSGGGGDSGGGSSNNDTTNGVPDIDTSGWTTLVDADTCAGSVIIKRKIEISGSIYNNYAAGIVGYASAATISNCISFSTISEKSSTESVSYRIYVRDHDINATVKTYIYYPNYKFDYNYYTQSGIAYLDENSSISTCYTTSGQTFESNAVNNTDTSAVGYTGGIGWRRHTCPHHTSDYAIVNLGGNINEYNDFVNIYVTIDAYLTAENGNVEGEYGVEIEKDERKKCHGTVYSGSGIPSGFSSNIWSVSDKIDSKLHLKCFYWIHQ